MHGIVSLLDAEHEAQVRELWRTLEGACGLTGIHVTPTPHFSWQIAADYAWDALKSTLREIAAAGAPFTVRTTGLALFSGPSPVVYLPLVRTPQLSALHAQIWARLAPLSVQASPYYAPEAWMPHISLAYQDVTPENLPCLMAKLAFRPLNWQIEVDNLTLIYEPEAAIGQVHHRFALGKRES